MRLGRDFTNLLYFDYLSGADKKKLESGELTIADMDAITQLAAKADIPGQVAAAKSLGLDHVELDGAVPNPYLNFDDKQKVQARKAAEANGISLSFHLPYSYVGAAVCSPENYDREASVGLHKRYLKFASEIGCEYAILHPGFMPFYHTTGRYLERARKGLIKSLIELGEFSSSRGIGLHLENNTAFDMIFFEPADICDIVEEVRDSGVNIYFCFDIGHWLTRADIGKSIPKQPERIIEEIPKGISREFHLNDYVPRKRIFHPPLDEGVGTLKLKNLQRYAELVSRKGVELIVVETAIRTREQVMKRKEIMKEETNYLKTIF
jgi:sugar phosphate isomerase/epimerase